jgi:hypothetical protein
MEKLNFFNSSSLTGIPFSLSKTITRDLLLAKVLELKQIKKKLISQECEDL